MRKLHYIYTVNDVDHFVRLFCGGLGNARYDMSAKHDVFA